MTICFLLTLPFFTSAQKGEIGGFVGLASYQGDLVDAPFTLKGSGLVAGFIYKRPLISKLSFRGGLAGGLYGGDDTNFEGFRDRDFSFSANFIEITGALEYSFLRRGKTNANGVFKKAVSPFINIGIGYMNANPDASAPGRIGLDPKDNNPNTSHFIIPIGLGIQWDISEKLTFAAEASHRTTFTDYLDGFSYSANPDADDWLIMGGLSLTYKFGQSAAQKFNLED